jgi:hypothetical protein
MMAVVLCEKKVEREDLGGTFILEEWWHLNSVMYPYSLCLARWL